MILTPRGRTLRDWIVGLTLSTLLLAFLVTAYDVGQDLKTERLEQETTR